MREIADKKTAYNEGHLYFQPRLLVGKKHCFMTKVKFITEDRMLRTKYLYENRMFRNKVNQSIASGGKWKDRVPLINSLINVQVWKRRFGAHYKRSERITISDLKVWADTTVYQYLLKWTFLWICNEGNELKLLKFHKWGDYLI